MPWWGRLVLFAGGIGMGSINGLYHSEGTTDLIGGVLIAVAIFAPRRRRYEGGP